MRFQSKIAYGSNCVALGTSGIATESLSVYVLTRFAHSILEGTIMFKWVSILFIAGCLLASFPVSGICQETKPPANEVTAKQKSSLQRLSGMKLSFNLVNKNFDETIEMLRLKTNLNFLIDDLPPEKLFTYSGNADIKAALDRICKFFDYSWKIGKNGDVQMLRSFTDELDAPQANLPELEKISTEMIDLFASVGVYKGRKTTSPYMTRNFYRSLDANQLQRLRRGEVIHASELQPLQFELLKGALSSYVFGYLIRQFGEFHSIMTSMKHMNLQILTTKRGAKKLFLNLAPQIDEGNSYLMRVFHPEKSNEPILTKPNDREETNIE